MCQDALSQRVNRHKQALVYSGNQKQRNYDWSSKEPLSDDSDDFDAESTDGMKELLAGFVAPVRNTNTGASRVRPAQQRREAVKDSSDEETGEDAFDSWVADEGRTAMDDDGAQDERGISTCTATMKVSKHNSRRVVTGI